MLKLRLDKFGDNCKQLIQVPNFTQQLSQLLITSLAGARILGYIRPIFNTLGSRSWSWVDPAGSFQQSHLHVPLKLKAQEFKFHHERLCHVS